MKEARDRACAPEGGSCLFHVAVMNMRSRRAMEKQGAVLSHHGPRPQNGVMVDFCYYRVDHASGRG